jgi:hypothetical protein
MLGLHKVSQDGKIFRFEAFHMALNDQKWLKPPDSGVRILEKAVTDWLKRKDRETGGLSN